MKKMNYFVVAVTAMALSGAALVPSMSNAQQALQPPSVDLSNATKDDVKQLLTTYENFLNQQMKQKGYDPRIARKISIALEDLDKYKKDNFPEDISEEVQKAFEKTEDYDDLDLLREDIITIQGMKPRAPKNFPGKCVAYKENPAVGNRQPTPTGVWGVTLCFDQADKLISCADHTKVKTTAQYRFASDAGTTTDGESVKDRPPAKGDGTVYMTEPPTPQNAKTVTVQCYNPAG